MNLEMKILICSRMVSCVSATEVASLLCRIFCSHFLSQNHILRGCCRPGRWHGEYNGLSLSFPFITSWFHPFPSVAWSVVTVLCCPTLIFDFGLFTYWTADIRVCRPLPHRSQLCISCYSLILALWQTWLANTSGFFFILNKKTHALWLPSQ